MYLWSEISVGAFLGGFCLSSFIGLYLSVKYGGLNRQGMWYQARVTSYVIWFLSGVGYVWLYHLMPESFSYSSTMLFLIAPCIALAPGLAALVIMLCVGDVVLFIFGEDTKNSKSF